MPGRPLQSLLEGAAGSLCIVDPVENYGKPFLTVSEQVDQLIDRGMIINDSDGASVFLRRIGYYRLSGYWYPYRRRTGDDACTMRSDEFEPGTTFQHVIDMYEFDRALRLIVLDAIERVEVSLRFHVGHTLGRRGPFAHTDPDQLAGEFTTAHVPQCVGAQLGSLHDQWLLNRFEEETRSKTDFVKHFKQKYGLPLPVWVATEIMDLDGLSKLYAGLLQKDRDTIAGDLGLHDASGAGNSSALKSWIANLTYVRNICAHHARLWNANIDKRIGTKNLRNIEKVKHLATPNIRNERIYPTLVVLTFLLQEVTDNSTWRDSLIRQLRSLPPRHTLSEMGFPPQWEDEIIITG